MASNKFKEEMSQSYCYVCRQFLPASNFLNRRGTILTKYNNGKFFICDDCAKFVATDIVLQYTSLELGVRAMCVFFQLPIIEEAIVGVIADFKNAARKDTFRWQYQYIRKLKELNIPDEYYDNFSQDTLTLPIVTRKLTTDELKTFKELNDAWGERTLGEYEFLERRWMEYTEGLTLTTAQISLYRQLCILELTIKIKEKAKEKITDEQKMVMNIMTKLGIDKFANNDKSLVENMLEFKIANIEETEPADHFEDVEMFKDIRGIDKYVEDNIKRPMRNLLLNSTEYKIIDKIVEEKAKGTTSNDES